MPLQHLTKSEARKFGLSHKNIQTIIFKKDKFTLKEARDWLKKHGYLYQNYRYETNYRRFQQNPPIIGANYYSKKINDDNIIIVFQSY